MGVLVVVEGKEALEGSVHGRGGSEVAAAEGSHRIRVSSIYSTARMGGGFRKAGAGSENWGGNRGQVT